MLLFESFIEQSKIPNAGKGLFTNERLPKGKVIIVPNQKHILLTSEELDKFPAGSIEQASSVRWFEDIHTVDPEWSEESHLNHSFNPNLLWHLGFVFALKDISKGEELTIDYSNLLDENTVLDYKDSITGLEIKGSSFKEKMRNTSMQLVQLFE